MSSFTLKLASSTASLISRHSITNNHLPLRFISTLVSSTSPFILKNYIYLNNHDPKYIHLDLPRNHTSFLNPNNNNRSSSSSYSHRSLYHHSTLSSLFTMRRSAVISPSFLHARLFSDGLQPLEVPKMGESITEGTLVAFLKKVGDPVQEDDVICQIETDKITVDVRAPKAGVVRSIDVEEGVTVAVGQQVATVEYGAAAATDAASPPTAPAPASASVKAPPAAKSGAAPLQPPPPPPPSLSPPPPPPTASSTQETPEITLATSSGDRRVAMTRMRRRIAERLKEAQNTAAVLTTFNEVDMSQLMSLRNDYKTAFEKKHGVKLGFMSAFVKACAVALIEQPEVNAYIDGGDIVYRDYVDISVAVSTTTGLVVPVLRGCENMDFATVEKTINDFGTRAKAGTLSIEEMQGGTFTISNGGVFGSLLSTPIINMPQSAILGMHSIQKRPVVVDDQIVIRPMMYLALSYDHRLIDGREAVTFLRRIKTLIEDPRRLLLDIDI